MAGTPADLTVNIDNTISHDHAYYGRGCSNAWGTDGLGGSATPCPDSNAGGRFIKTADNETQKNGTLFNYQAATSGSGGSITTDKADTPDTFCPLGWQMPYGGTGGVYYDKSKSWNYLFNEYSITNNQSSATKAKSYPLSFIIGGSYHWGTGLLNDRGVRGEMWSSTFEEKYFAYKPAFTDTNVYEQLHEYRNYGAPIRSVCLLVFLHRRHGGRN